MYKDFLFNSKRGILLAILSFCLIGLLHSQDSYEDFVDQQAAELDEFQEEYKNYKEKITEEFDLFYKAEQEAYNKYKDEIEQKWGEFKGSTNKDWVEYNSDKTTRTSVDFEKGEIKVEVLILDGESDEIGSNEISLDFEAKEKLEQAITDLVSSEGEKN